MNVTCSAVTHSNRQCACRCSGCVQPNCQVCAVRVSRNVQRIRILLHSRCQIDCLGTHRRTRLDQRSTIVDTKVKGWRRRRNTCCRIQVHVPQSTNGHSSRQRTCSNRIRRNIRIRDVRIDDDIRLGSHVERSQQRTDQCCSRIGCGGRVI